MNKKLKNGLLLAFILMLTVVNIKYLVNVFNQQHVDEKRKEFLNVCDSKFTISMVKKIHGLHDFSVTYSIQYEDSLVQGTKILPGVYDQNVNLENFSGECQDSVFLLKLNNDSRPVLTIDL